MYKFTKSYFSYLISLNHLNSSKQLKTYLPKLQDILFRIIDSLQQMDCKYVRESSCLSFCFHPHSSSLFYLTNTKNRLRVIQENLYTGLVVNQLAVPLRQQNLNVDNYILNYSPEGKYIVLTLSNHILIFSLEFKSLLFIGEAHHSKTPCFIERAVINKNILYFSATEHHQLFSLSIKQCVQTNSMPAFSRFKLPPQVLSICHSVNNNRLVAICSDNNLRVWDIQSGSALKGVSLDRVGELTCLTFSKDGEYLLIGTSNGNIQVWDGATLGVTNTLVLSKAVCKDYIQSLAWFHYSGESQSRRFLMFTRDGNVKLFSFYFERVKDGKEKLMGKANQLSLLFINKSKMSQKFEIRSHQYANFIYFHPGVLLYLVDSFPRMYFPVISSQLVPSFQSLVPNARKEVAWQPNFFFVDGLNLKRLRNQAENKIALTSVLEYEGLKILRMDYRPKFSLPQQLPLKIQKGVPQRPIRYKFLINYYLGNMIRSIVLSDVNLSGSNDNIDSYKEHSGHAAIFLGPQANLEPLLLTLGEDKQTITVISQQVASSLERYTQQQRVYLAKAGQVYSKQLKIKVQKIFQTPFRNSYVILYLTDNLLRFSNNIHIHSDLMDYEVYQTLGLRLDYTDIVIDVVWTSRGQIGCVVCLQKAVFINDQLKVIKTVPLQGYVVQGQFIGYTLIVTTKVDVQYVDISGKALQLYCIENYESRYLILGILTDRIIGIQRYQGVINCKVRYFNLMQPLLAGYINYYTSLGAPVNGQTMKAVIEGYAPYHAVSEQFLNLLNKSGWSNFSRYFIESHIKLYSRSIRASTLNSQAHIQRFINPKVWLQHGSRILDYLLYYEDLRNSSDPYDIEKSKEYQGHLITLTSNSLDSIKQAIAQEEARASSRLTIAANFGEQAQFQIFYEYSDKQNIFVKMELLPFKASDDRQWIGLNSLYLQSKIGQNDNDLDINAVKQEKDEKEHNQHDSDQQGGQFKDLIVYYRFDDGKGDFIDDLSDYNNEGTLIFQGQPWRLLDEQPMELQDKWGKKCPPQYAIRGIVKRQKRLGGKAFKNFTAQLWFISQASTFFLLKIGQNFTLGLENGIFYFKTIKVNYMEKAFQQGLQYNSGSWNNLTFVYTKQSNQWIIYMNGTLYCKGRQEIKLGRDHLEIGNSENNVQFTEFRLWRKNLSAEAIKQYLRSPLEIVAQKRKKLKMRIKQKKKKQKSEKQGQFFPSFPF